MAPCSKNLLHFKMPYRVTQPFEMPYRVTQPKTGTAVLPTSDNTPDRLPWWRYRSAILVAGDSNTSIAAKPMLSMQLNCCSCNSPPEYQGSNTALHATTGQTALYENVTPQHALWTFNISTSTWQQQHPTGQLPEPHLAHVATGLAVVNGKAYALINDPQQSKRLEVYELDLATWHWRRVPGVGAQPSCRRAASAVVIQVIDTRHDFVVSFP